MTIDMDTAASLLGYPKPVHHRQRVCATCESVDDFVFVDELEREGSPNGTGYARLMCNACGELVADDGTNETRYWVGH